MKTPCIGARRCVAVVVYAAALLCGTASLIARADNAHDSSRASEHALNGALTAVLAREGFTGTNQADFRKKLGRPIDRQRAELGRVLWFDIIGGLNNDNTCGGCHSPTNGFGDTQPIAIGVDKTLSSDRIVRVRATSGARPMPPTRRCIQP